MSDDGTPSLHDSDRIDDAIAFRIHRTNRLLLTHLARFLETQADGLAPERWFILARLHQDGPMRQGELTEPALTDAPNVSRLVEALVSDGLVERSEDPKDRRARNLSLTTNGRAVVRRTMKAARSERAAVFAGMDGEKLQALAHALDIVDRNVRALLVDDEA